MSASFAAIRTATRGLVYALRCLACEMVISWGIKIAPAGYHYSAAEVAAEFYKRGKLGLPPVPHTTNGQ